MLRASRIATAHLLGLASLALAAPQAPALDERSERAALLEGVHALGGLTHPGSALAFGDGAFVVACDAGGVPLASAARAGRGRVLALGHEGWLSQAGLAGEDGAQLVRNAARWLGAGKRRPALACAGDAELAAALRGLGLRAERELPLARTDVLVLREEALARQGLDELERFVVDGGGLLVAATGWGWQQLHPARVLGRDAPANRLVTRFGLAFGLEIASVEAGTRLVLHEPDALAQAGRALERCLAGESSALAAQRLAAALAALPDEEPRFVLPLRRAHARGALAEAVLARVGEVLAARAWRPLTPRFGPWWVFGPARAGRTPAEAAALEAELARCVANGPGPELAREARGARWSVLALEGDGRELDVGPLRLAQLRPEEQGRAERAQQAYLWRSIEADEPTTLALALGVDGRARVWLDGAVVLDSEGGAGMQLERVPLPLTLEAGRHHLLIRLESEGERFGLVLARADAGEPSREAISAAIERGLGWLLARQRMDGSWDAFREYGPGYTALVAYVLLRCGLRPEHPAVAHALAYARALPAEHTYSSAARVLALAAAERVSADEEQRSALHAELARDVERLRGWQESEGLWGYPLYPDGTERPADLSTTLYAALALHAAAERGLAIPESAWSKALAGLWRVREGGAPGTSRARDALTGGGFAYRVGEQATGSMTTAGLSVLVLAREALGERLDKRAREELELALQSGLAWLDAHATLEENPGNARFHFFFLYGLERIGSLLGLEVLGRARWYPLGAERLLALQAPDGSWRGQDSDRNELQDTPLALLFLARASAPVSGEGAAARRAAPVGAGGGPLLVHATGSGPFDVWLDGLAPQERERLGAAARVEHVRWSLVRAGRELAVLERALDPTRPAEAQRFEARLALAAEVAAGALELHARARVALAAEPGTEDAARASLELECEPLPLELVLPPAPARLRYALDHARNLLRAPAARCEASSERPGEEARLACDASHATVWRSDPSDAAPWWRASLAAPVLADRLLLSLAGDRPLDADERRPARVELVLDGRERLELELCADPREKSVLRFGEPRRVGRIELRVLAASSGAPGGTGFSELQLVLGG